MEDVKEYKVIHKLNSFKISEKLVSMEVFLQTLLLFQPLQKSL